MSSRLQITARVFDDGDLLDRGHVITPKGRLAETLLLLIDKAARGATTLHDFPPGQRASHYVFRLRRDFGLNIETKSESKRGVRYGRYILRSRVVVDRDQQWVAA